MTLNFEDYVRGVYYLQQNTGIAKPSDLARRLSVSKNTATLMVQKLVFKKLLSHEKYGDVKLTAQGYKMAKKLTYRHRLIELFLTRTLEISANTVHEEACRLEHCFSDASIRGLEKLLDHPSTCPHGKPLK